MASLSQGRTAPAAQCGLFTYKSVPVIFEPPCILNIFKMSDILKDLTQEILKQDRRSTFNVKLCRVRVMFIPPRLF